MKPEVTFTLDGRNVKAPAGANLLEVTRGEGIDIPSLCHDPRLEPYGACRLCLVEVTGARGPVPACATFVREGMEVVTESPALTEMRRTGLELLLSEHCGDCISPCQVACPAGIDIQGFVALIASGEELEAARLIREKMPLPASVGMICPRFCEQECRRTLVEEPVAICALKRFAGEAALETGALLPPEQAQKDGSVAVVGGGPAGITAAYYLSQAGYRVTIFEASSQLGGMMRYGIPSYRLPKDLLQQEIDLVTSRCRIETETVMGRDFDLAGLQARGYQAVFLALGAQANQPLKIPGEDLPGVYSGIGFLRRVASGENVAIGSRVVVVGGGNTAMDAARTAVRLGACEVKVVYRRSEAEMPANPEEVEQAKEEGVQFQLLTNPTAFLGDNQLTSLECVKMELGEPDAGGRRRPVPVAGSEFTMSADTVIVAAGQVLSPEGAEGLSRNRRGFIETGSDFRTSIPWVFAGGDCVSGPATVVAAVGAGRKAALTIDRFLQGAEDLTLPEPYNCSRGRLEDQDPGAYICTEKIPRAHIPLTEAGSRRHNFDPIERCFTGEEARAEATRCLSCGCREVFDCRLRELATRLGVTDRRLGNSKRRWREKDSNPYLIQDQNKCVLCAACVRICQEVQGVGALGLVNRGSETKVEPSLGLPLEETMCEACGQCLSVCPTGALTVRNFLSRPGPWQEDLSDSACTACGVGCLVELHTVAGNLNRITSPKKNPVNYGNLCKEGMFPQAFLKGKQRLTTPMMKKQGQLQESTWEEAMEQAALQLTEQRTGVRGSRGLAVLVSPRWTNQENYLAQWLSRVVLHTPNIDSLQPVNLMEGEGGRIKPVTFPELQESDLIILYRCNTPDSHPVAAQNIRRAVKSGARLTIVASKPGRLDPLARSILRVNPQYAVQLLRAMVAYYHRYNLTLAPDNTGSGIEDLIALGDFHWLNPSKFVEFLHLLLRAKRPVIVFDAGVTGATEKEMLAALLTVTGNHCRPGSGWLPLLPAGNSLGQHLMGVHSRLGPLGRPLTADYRNQLAALWGTTPPMFAGLDKEKILAGLETGETTGVIICAGEEEVEGNLWQQPGFKLVITPLWQEEYKEADIILPGALSMESNGVITNCEGREISLSSKLTPPGNKDNYRVLADLAQALGALPPRQERISQELASLKAFTEEKEQATA